MTPFCSNAFKSPKKFFCGCVCVCTSDPSHPATTQGPQHITFFHTFSEMHYLASVVSEPQNIVTQLQRSAPKTDDHLKASMYDYALFRKLYDRLGPEALHRQAWKGLTITPEVLSSDESDDSFGGIDLVISPGQTVSAEFPSVPTGRYNVCIRYHQAFRDCARRYISVESSHKAWLRLAFRSPSVKIHNEVPILFDSSWLYLKFPDMIQIPPETHATVTLTLYRPTVRDSGAQMLLPVECTLVPWKPIKPDKEISKNIRRIYVQTAVLVSPRQCPKKHCERFPLERPRCRGLHVASSGFTEYSSLFRNVSPGLYTPFVSLVHPEADFFDATWLHYMVGPLEVKYQTMYGTKTPLIDELDQYRVTSVFTSQPECESHVRGYKEPDEPMPVRVHQPHLTFPVHDESTGIYMTRQVREKSGMWRHLKGLRIRLQEASDVLLTFRIPLLESCVDVTLDHMGLTLHINETPVGEGSVSGDESDHHSNDTSDDTSASSGEQLVNHTGRASPTCSVKPEHKTAPRNLRFLELDFWKNICARCVGSDILTIAQMNKGLFKDLLTSHFLGAVLVTRFKLAPVRAQDAFVSMDRSEASLVRWATDTMCALEHRLINHPHADRARYSPNGFLPCQFKLKPGHYSILCITNTHLDLQSVHVLVTLDPLIADDRSSDYSALLRYQTLIQDHEVCDKTCYEFHVKETFCLTRFECVSVLLSLKNTSFEKMELVQHPNPVIPIPPLHRRVQHILPPRRQTTQPTQLVHCGVTSSPHHTDRVRSSLRLAGAITYLPAGFRQVLPAVPPGMYYAYLRMYGWEDVTKDEDQWILTWLEVEVCVVAAPRHKGQVTFKSLMLDLEDSEIYVPDFHPTTTFSSLFTNALPATPISRVREIVSTDGLARGWHTLELQKPIYIPWCATDTIYNVHVYVRLPDALWSAVDVFGLKPS
eukprot:Blabericola_migrator_1__8579@NODE_448_length_8373_cov_125_949193_g350_i0_p1_GENE_NODE_448_length_8373_cov_125_949193_g350_i0NODE_448_length_8373_cov_125_949193_g350_i0_p1_ORF_typecomplete_len933_score119_55_NODE_448_length_8373_cov_125_949193_g350_i09663764